MKALATGSKARRAYAKSGLWSLKATVRLLGGRAIDRRTAVGQALEAWRDDLISDLGGRDVLSTQQVALVDVAIKTKLMLDSIDAWILQQPSLVNARKRALLPVVRERASLASSFQSLMKDLGLERRAKPVPSLREFLAQRSAAAAATTEAMTTSASSDAQRVAQRGAGEAGPGGDAA